MKNDKKKQTTLVMLSGGTDSVYALYNILKETDDEVLVHHINLLNSEGRHQVEKQSCDKIVDYLKQNVRDFSYSESFIHHQSYSFLGYDSIATGHTAGVIIKNHAERTGNLITRWVLGICSEDILNMERRAHVNRICSASSYPFSAPDLYVDLQPTLSKEEEIKAMPAELAAMIWSCRFPVLTPSGPKECGSCRTCKVVLPIKAAHLKN